MRADEIGRRSAMPQPRVAGVRYRDNMMGAAARTPVMLQVFRYDAGNDTLRIVVGGALSPLPPADLIDRAREAMNLRSFVCHTITDYNDAVGDEFCFIPRGDRCEIMGIHTNGWRRHHGDHRRGLLDILNDLAAAVARGRLHFLDDQELEGEVRRGAELIAHAVTDSTSVAMARNAADLAFEVDDRGHTLVDSRVQHGHSALSGIARSSISVVPSFPVYSETSSRFSMMIL